MIFGISTPRAAGHTKIATTNEATKTRFISLSFRQRRPTLWSVSTLPEAQSSPKSIASLSVQTISNPVRPVTPIDPRPIFAYRPCNPRSLPVRPHTPLAIERSSSPVPTLVLQRQISPSLLNRALQRSIPIRIPVPIQVGRLIPTTTGATSPERSIRPVNPSTIST